MTHGLEKSDRLIQPKKLSNNAEKSVAEEAEGRRLAKGNPLQVDTNRIQSRRQVNSALRRIRQATELHRKAKLTSLLHIYAWTCFREAYLPASSGRAARASTGDLWRLGENLESIFRTFSRTASQGCIPSENPARRVWHRSSDGGNGRSGYRAEDKDRQWATVAVLNQIAMRRNFLGSRITASSQGAARTMHWRPWTEPSLPRK